MTKKKITIEGMHCASCAVNIGKSLKKIPGLEVVSVSVMTNKAIVESDEDTSDEEIKKAVSNVGYKVTKIE